MKIFIVILLLTVLPSKTNVDLGPPNILAICKVTLKSGQEHEGFIMIASGGYDGLQPNGFYAHNGNNGIKALFGLNRITKNEVETFYKKDCFNMYYMYYKWGNMSISPSETPVFRENGDSFLLLNYKSARKYTLSKTIVLHTDLHMYEHDQYVDNPPKAICINVEDIVSFKLLSNPNPYWIKEIEKERERFADQEASSWPGYTVDHNSPFWYHELKKDKKNLDYIKRELLKTYHRFH